MQVFNNYTYVVEALKQAGDTYLTAYKIAEKAPDYLHEPSIRSCCSELYKWNVVTRVKGNGREFLYQLTEAGEDNIPERFRNSQPKRVPQREYRGRIVAEREASKCDGELVYDTKENIETVVAANPPHVSVLITHKNKDFILEINEARFLYDQLVKVFG
jgi:hypothetical protein